MKRIATLLILSFGFSSFAQDSLNVQKIGHLDYGTTIASDIWGYTASNGDEFAIMGLRNAVSIVDVSQTPTMNEVIRIPGVPSVWRDIKTWGHHAYITHDQTLIPSIMPDDGLLIVDLDSIEYGKQPDHWNLYPKFVEPNIGLEDSMRTAHNLYIDENGIMYLFGSNFPQSGVCILYDVATNPDTPQFLGTWSEHYLHDGMVRGDTMWGSAVYAGEFYVVDVSNKANPQTMASFPTSSAFTHNNWISDDNQTLFTTDEVASAYIGAYDVSDLSNISEIDLINSSLDNIAIPHNTHVYNDFLVTSYYTSGLQIVDANEPDIMVEVGYYDTSPFQFTSSFQGAWGAYPYFPSEKIAVSDMEEGLFILDTDYPRAGYWRATVVDGITNAPIPGAAVIEQNSIFARTTDINGTFKFGILPTSLTVDVTASGYNVATYTLGLSAGVVETDTIFMFPLGFGVGEFDRNQYRVFPNPSSTGNITIDGLKGDTELIRIIDIQGRALYESVVLGIAGQYDIQAKLSAGTYQIQLVNSNGSILSYKQVIL
jgi:choice-of-anchor B domain-containing protein